jgi:membrane-bound metal-dependent hydrolase YbcI (DUF457 family)
MILGHMALAAIGKQTCFQRESFVFLATAALVPDFLDKPLSMFFSLPGRGVGHSLIAFAAVAAVVMVLAARLELPQKTVVAGMALWLSHLAGDLLQWQILFWPFLGPVEPTVQFHFWEKIRQFYMERLYPEQFWLDVGCVTVAALLYALNWWTQRRRFVSTGANLTHDPGI